MVTATVNTYRYRTGETNPNSGPFKSGVAVSIGDLLYEDPADSYTIKPASSFTWGTAVGTPAAPTVTNGGVAFGTSLTASATGVKVSYQFEWGEGALSAAGSATPTAAAAIKLAKFNVPAASGIVAVNVYVETSAGSGTYQLYQQIPLIGGTTGVADFFILGYGNGAAPAASPVTSAALDVTQFAFSNQFVGVAAQGYDGVNASAFGIGDGKIRYDTDGVFDFACASGTFTVGQWVGPAKDTGNNLLAGTVAAAQGMQQAIGKVEVGGSSLTTVRVRIFAPYAKAYGPGVM